MLVRFSPFVLVLLAVPTAHSENPKLIDFARDVKPIFAAHCVSCHGAEKQRAG